MSSINKFELAKSHFFQGLDLFKAEQYEPAEMAFRESLLLVPERESTLTNLIATLISQKKYLDVCDFSEKILKINPSNYDSWLNFGIAKAALGKHEEAIEAFQKSISINSSDYLCWFHQGLSQVALGDVEAGLACFEVAIEFNSESPDTWFHAGLALDFLGRSAEGLTALNNVIKIDPNHLDAWFHIGNILFILNNHEGAIEAYDKVIALRPNLPEAWSNKANIFFNAKKYNDALLACEQALLADDQFSDAWTNKGNTLLKLGNPEGALIAYQHVIEIDPNSASAWSNRGNALLDLREYKDARESFQNAIKLRPDLAEAWANLGAVLIKLKEFTEARTVLETATRLKPDFAQAWCNLGTVLLNLDNAELALTWLDRAIQLDPNLEAAWSTKGNALTKLNRFKDATAAHDKAVGINPEFAGGWGNRGRLLARIGLYSLAESSYREAIRLAPQDEITRSNLLLTLNYSEKITPSDLLIEAKAYGRLTYRPPSSRFPILRVSKVSTLKVGFVSGDLRNHPVGYFMEGLVKHLDQKEFELFGFPTTSKSDELTERVKPFFKEFIPIYNASDQDAAALIHGKGIHILVDLSGHSADNRLPVFSFKPAPVQVTWLGLPMTTGVSEMDYVIGDPHALPREFECHFTEAVWRLPETYICLTPPGLSVPVGEPPALANKHVTFASFNNLSKMNDYVVKVWSQILLATPNAVLLLKTQQLADADLCEETRRRFASHGVARERLKLKETYASRTAHLAEYNAVDIALDTFPYPGVTTSAEALYMGVPVLSMRGDRFLSATATSIAKNTGLEDWVAQDQEDYINKAVAFASDLPRLAEIKRTLRDRVLQSPLFDSPRFAKHFGEALWGMWHSKFPKAQ